jgi:hypothetical protein
VARERFIGEKIAVDRSTADGALTSFTWRRQRYAVDAILRVWQDWGFPLDRPPKKQAWRARKHRNCYLVSSGEREFEIYQERGAIERWILLTVKEKGANGECGCVR